MVEPEGMGVPDAQSKKEAGGLCAVGCVTGLIMIAVFMLIPTLGAQRIRAQKATGTTVVTVKVDEGCRLEGIQIDGQTVMMGSTGTFSAPTGKMVTLRTRISGKEGKGDLAGRQITFPSEPLTMEISCDPANITFRE